MTDNHTLEILESDELLHRLAEAEHTRWAHWQQYLHGHCERQPDGALLIPAELVARWEKQIATPYSKLSDEEKRSDQEQVREYLPIIIDMIRLRGT